MKRCFLSIAIVAIAVLALVGCSGKKDTSTSGSGGTATESRASGGNTGGNSKLINEWPKAIYDPYNIPAYTDGKIVCVDNSPYQIPSANTAIEGSTVHIADASFDKLIAYVKDLRSAGIGTVLNSAISFLEEKEDDSGSVSFTLSDGKILHIAWWGYQDQQDFYLGGALEQVKYTYNVGIFIHE